MKKLISPILFDIQEVLSNSPTINITSDHVVISIGRIFCRVELREISCDYGWNAIISITGWLPANIALFKGDFFSIKAISSQGFVKFNAGISEEIFQDGKRLKLNFVSCGEIEMN